MRAASLAILVLLGVLAPQLKLQAQRPPTAKEGDASLRVLDERLRALQATVERVDANLEKLRDSVEDARIQLGEGRSRVDILLFVFTALAGVVIALLGWILKSQLDQARDISRLKTLLEARGGSSSVITAGR